MVQNVKEEAHSSSEEDGVTLNDQSSVGNAQELSSQASSAEPHTPSPQYSAARVHDSTFESTIDAATPDPARQVPATSLDRGDPHLANLLSGLQRSAVSLSLDDTDKPQVATVEVVTPAASVPRPPVASIQPPVSPDWSARVPAMLSSPMERPPQAKLSPAVSPTRHTARPQPIPTCTNSPSLKAPATSPGHTRRGSTADISPYLSHSRNIAKEMRYISILESVAQESDRATSRMGHRTPMTAPLQHAHAAVPLPPSPIRASVPS